MYTENGYIRKVSALEPSLNHIGLGYTDYSFPDYCDPIEVQPIPITEEILKANGFEYDNYGYFVVESQNIHFWIIRYGEEDGCKHFSGHWVIGEIIPIDYVHELQHVLRLCGMNELADNFVIEKGE